jgi:hypothetical protein
MKVSIKVTFKNPPVQVYEKHWHSNKKQLKRKNKIIRFWTDEEIDIAINGYNVGKTAREIGLIIGRSTTAVNHKISILLSNQTLWNLKK